jgi:hypothetical protein
MLIISMDQEEIEKALTNHVSETMSGLDLSLYDINIKLVAGRKENGLRAEIGLALLGPGPVIVALENDAGPSQDPAAEAPEQPAEQVVEPFDFDND